MYAAGFTASVLRFTTCRLRSSRRSSSRTTGMNSIQIQTRSSSIFGLWPTANGTGNYLCFSCCCCCLFLIFVFALCVHNFHYIQKVFVLCGQLSCMPPSLNRILFLMPRSSLNIMRHGPVGMSNCLGCLFCLMHITLLLHQILRLLSQF